MDHTLSATEAGLRQDTESPLRNKVKKFVIAVTRASLKKAVFASAAVVAVSGGIVTTGVVGGGEVAHAATSQPPSRVGWVWRHVDGSVFGVCPDGYHAEFFEIPRGTTEARYWVAADKNNLTWKTYTGRTYDQVQAFIRSRVIVKPTQYGYERNVDLDGSGPVPPGVELVPATQANLKLDAVYEGDCIINGKTIPGPYNTGSSTDIAPGNPVTTPIPVETPAPTTNPTPVETPAPTTEPTTSTETTPPTTPAPTTPVETPAPTTPPTKEPTTPVETPAPTTEPTTPTETTPPTEEPTIPTETTPPTTDPTTPVETPAPTTDPTTPTTPVETPASTTEPTTPTETTPPTEEPTTPVETPAPTTPVETPKPTTPVETAPPAKPAPTPKPAPVKMVTRTFQLDKGMVRTAAAASRYAALDNDGVLNYREFSAKDWRHLCERVEFIKVTVPANATKAQLIKAINAKSIIGDISTPAKLDKLPARKFIVQAWEMNPKATVKAPFGARRNLTQVYIGRSALTNR